MLKRELDILRLSQQNKRFNPVDLTLIRLWKF